jgi:hypothetical protein
VKAPSRPAARAAGHELIEGFEPVTDVRTVDAGAYLQLGLTLSKLGSVAPVERLW